MEPGMERRKIKDRRQRNDGPPPGARDRRCILERRILSLTHHSIADWLAEPATLRKTIKPLS